jgi:hypothetical protein
MGRCRTVPYLSRFHDDGAAPNVFCQVFDSSQVRRRGRGPRVNHSLSSNGSLSVESLLLTAEAKGLSHVVSPNPMMSWTA